MTSLSTSPRLLCLMLRAQHLARAESQTSGYAMVITSIVTLMMFSLLAAALAITNLSKSSTNAYMEGNSTFYAAESGLNKRANEIRQKFVNYATPDGTSPGQVAGSIAGIENMSACIGSDTSKWGTVDFACQKLDLNYNHASNLQVSTGADGKSLSATDATGNVKYTAYTFASDRTVYTDPVKSLWLCF
jgi:Tfp pilus assembly protein PilX